MRARERRSHRSGEPRASRLLEPTALGSAQVAPIACLPESLDTSSVDPAPLHAHVHSQTTVASRDYLHRSVVKTMSLSKRLMEPTGAATEDAAWVRCEGARLLGPGTQQRES